MFGRTYIITLDCTTQQLAWDIKNSCISGEGKSTFDFKVKSYVIRDNILEMTVKGFKDRISRSMAKFLFERSSYVTFENMVPVFTFGGVFA